MPSNAWSIKYSFYTGYVRPFMNRDNVDLLSQKNQSHDLQILYKSNGFHSGVTLYRSEVDDFIAFDWASGAWKNSSAIQMRGVELEIQYDISNDSTLYGNYAYAKSEFEEPQSWSDLMDSDGRVAGVPRHTFNIGIDWDFSASSTLNLNLRGWSDAITRWDWGVDDGFESFGTEMYLDASARTTDFAGIRNLTGGIYIKNALNNDSPHPDAVEGGYVKGPHRRQAGLYLKCAF
jgi:hypothetical protein